ncbi:MAG: Gfo/Idh/MocA family oxidoreductase [Alphaproteobacteria bacterium]|nr:Gfo/Idh/MocA family oxidoreductase [Alphaproteobacteria bacterium]MDE2493988.1 Gfo/Idh/MocA family oxidoreductase [Alphaproteobacteria bacterium]
MLHVALLGLGKMGLSHQAIINAHKDVELVAVCDTVEYVLGVLEKYAGVKTYTDYHKLLATESLDAVFVATPSRFHAEMVRAALDANLHVFCEKPFCLNVTDGRYLAEMAESRRLVNQVGYHYRFVGVFRELKHLLDAKVLGKLNHIRAEAYGPVVLRSKTGTWRAKKSDGGGCLYDYASHAIDLLNYLVGPPESVGGTALNRLFSQNVEDEVYSNLYYQDGVTGHIAANWSDESCRKMSMKVTAWGTNGKIVADRQELQIYLRTSNAVAQGLNKGWNVRYTTELTEPVWYYLRGEEYSAQVDHFVSSVSASRTDTCSTFRTALDTDIVIESMIRDAARAKGGTLSNVPDAPTPRKVSLRKLIGLPQGTGSTASAH